jgi:hypothetical protein
MFMAIRPSAANIALHPPKLLGQHLCDFRRAARGAVSEEVAGRSAVSAPSASYRAKSAKRHGQQCGGHFERCGCYSPRQTNDNLSTSL